MKAIADLSTFTKILASKGYDGYFQTQGGYGGKLKESIGEYLKSSHTGTEGIPKAKLMISGYLAWAGEDKPRVECCLWVKHLNGKFFLSKMEVTRKDQFGQILKQKELKDITVLTAPTVVEAIAMVREESKQKLAASKSRLRL